MTGGVGGRFDLEEARREAQEAKRRARIRAIVSNSVLGVVVLALLIGGKIGWDKWQEKREADREAAEAAQLEEERREAARKKAEAEKAKALAEKRAAEREAEKARREAERRRKEEAKEAERRAREEERRRKEEERRLADEIRVEQQELRKFEDREVTQLRFSVDDHICYGYGIEPLTDDVSVDEARWTRLSSLAQKRLTIQFLEELRGENVTNDFSEVRYPARAVFDKLLDNLDKERFTLVVRLKDEARTRRLALVAADLEKGLAEPDGARALKAGSRVVGWTVPFAFGDKSPIFLIDQAAADKFAREWSTMRRKLRSEAAKLDNRDEYVDTRLAKELPDFIRSVKIEVTAPPPEEKPARGDSASKRSSKPRPTMKGAGSNIRTLGGPKAVR